MPYADLQKRKRMAAIRSYFRRKHFPWKTRLDSIKQRCNNPRCSSFQYYGAKGIQCNITEEEIKQLWFRDGADKMQKPSVDRINSFKDYTLENCRIIESSDNSAKMAQENNPKKKSKQIAQYSLSGEFLRVWNNGVQIQNELGFGRGLISKVCNGIRKQAYGSMWRFV